jgi:hypothetical protein
MKLPKVDIKKILYATDLSEGAKYAFAYAVSLANTYHASITILHVLFDDRKTTQNCFIFRLIFPARNFSGLILL